MVFWLSIALGGALGAVGRYRLSLFFNRQLGRYLPWATLIVNILGAGLVGFLAAFFLAPVDDSLLIHSSSPLWAGLGIGFCGSLTTISSWSLEVVRLALDRRPWALMAYMGLTLSLCLLAASLGFLLGGQFVAS